MLSSACISAILAVVVAGSPRYHFSAGEHLVYEGDEVATLNGRRLGIERTTELRIVDARGDDAWLVIVTQRHQRFSETNGEKTLQPAREDLYVVELHADGRVPERDDDTFGVLDRMLPVLPASADVTSWTYRGGDVTYDASAVPVDQEDVVRFAVTSSSPMMTVQGFTATHTYDLANGRIAAVANAHGYKGRATRSGVETLVRTLRMPDDVTRALAAEAERARRLERDYRAALTDALASGVPDEGRRGLAAAVTKLEAGLATIESPLLLTHLGRMARGHHASAPAYERRLAQQATIVGRPAPDWTLPVIDGDTLALRDLRGQVVVLDFWYRNCGWCLRAMPQIERLHADLEGRPVQILGMNVDPEESDARHVMAIVKPTYPTVRADRSLARRYGVQAYPTVAVIDQTGNVARVFTGYSPRLKEQITSTVDALLAR